MKRFEGRLLNLASVLGQILMDGRIVGHPALMGMSRAFDCRGAHSRTCPLGQSYCPCCWKEALSQSQALED